MGPQRKGCRRGCSRFFTATYTGVNAGMVVVVADDPGMHSSQNEQDTRMLARASHAPVLDPSNSQECKDFLKLAYEISEKYDTPVILRVTTRIAHARTLVELDERVEVRLREYKPVISMLKSAKRSLPKMQTLFPSTVSNGRTGKSASSQAVRHITT